MEVVQKLKQIWSSDYWMDNPKIKNELIITRGPTRLSN